MSHLDDYGWTAHRDRTGTMCEYCGEPSVQTLVVAPSPGKGQPDIRIGLCPAHRREPEPPLPNRRQAAKGVPQLAIVEPDGRGGERVTKHVA